jgi:hypothetical protein
VVRYRNERTNVLLYDLLHIEIVGLDELVRVFVYFFHNYVGHRHIRKWEGGGQGEGIL